MIGQFHEQCHSIDGICEMIGDSKPTLYKHVRKKQTDKIY